MRKKEARGSTAPIDPILTEGIAAALRAATPSVIEMPDIVTFAEHRSFVGDGGPGLYPRQRTLLRLIALETERFTPYDEDIIGAWAERYYAGPYRWGLQPDVMRRVEILKQRGRTHFGTVVFIGGRRGGKGHVGALLAAWQMYGLLAMDDPQARYGIAAGKHLRTLITATTHPQARDNFFADLFRLLTHGECFREHLALTTRNHVTLWTPADLRRIAELGRNDQRSALEQASIRASAVAPNASGARGSACTFLGFDEFAHSLEGTESVRTGEEVYRALVPSLGQVHPDGIVYVPTSPWTKETHAHRLYEMALEVDADGEPRYPDIVLIHLPSWGAYEDAFDPVAAEGRTFVSVPMAADERVEVAEDADPASYTVEYLAQWREVEAGFLNPVMVDRIFAPFCSACGMPVTDDTTACDLCGGAVRVLEEQDRGILALVYRGHADPAAKGPSNFAYVIAHTEEFITAEGETWFHVIVDRIQVYRAGDYPDHVFPYDRIEEAIVADVMGFRTLEVFSLDQFSIMAIMPHLRDRLRMAGHAAVVKEVTFTKSSNPEREYTFKAAISRGWVHSFRDRFGPQGRSLLEAELKSLKLKGERVVAPTGGPIRTDDVADSLMVLVDELLKEQLRRRPMNSRLTPPLVAGAPGGYHTGGVANSQRSAREILASYGQQRASRQTRIPWGMMDPARRQLLMPERPSSAALRRGPPTWP